MASSSRSSARSARQRASRPASSSAPPSAARRSAASRATAARSARSARRASSHWSSRAATASAFRPSRACSSRSPRRPPAGRRARRTRPAQQQQPQRRGRGQARPVPPGELPQPVAGRRRAGQHRLVGQVALHVRGEAVGRLVPAAAVLLQGLHHDPVQLAADQPAQLRRLQSRGWPRSTAASSVVLSRVLGRGGSSSRISRSISSERRLLQPLPFAAASCPVSSSYRSTPSE